MYRYLEEQALVIARRMIYAFYVDKDIDTVISYLNSKDFTYTCANTNDIIIGVENMRDFLKQSLKYIDGYKIVNENYNFCSSSADSCLVVADIETQATKYHLQYIAGIKFLFYFKMVGEKLLVSFYQVQIPPKKNKMQNSIFLPPEKTPIELHVDQQYHYEMLSKLMDENFTAMKVMHYDESLPYHYVNLQYLKLLQCSRIRDFVIENKNSVEHIYPADQKRYSDYVKAYVQQTLKNVRPSESWKWLNSYYIVYRLCHRENFYVLEWGNLFTQNFSPMIMAIVLPLQDISIFYSMLDQNSILGGGWYP